MLCCGQSSQGQLGLGASEKEVYSSLVLNNFIAGQQCKQVASSLNHTLFLLDDGSVFSCGSNDFDQLGHSKTKSKPHRVEALGSVECVQVGCGLCFSVCLSVDGRLFLFGSMSGQVGVIHFRKPKLVSGIDGRLVQFAVGDYHLIAMDESGLLYAMGDNGSGQCGVGPGHGICERPSVIPFSGVPVTHISCGSLHTVLVSKSGFVYCFGSNRFGQLGVDGASQLHKPTEVVQLNGQKSRFAACGERHTVIVTLQGGVFSFGSSSHGQLGHCSTNHEPLPRKIFELMGSVVSQIACGRCHTLAFTPATGKVYAFGNNSNGQLGLSTKTAITNPTAIPLNFTNDGCIVTSIFAGGDQTFIRFSRDNPRPPLDYRHITDKRSPRTLTLAFARELCGVSGLERKFVSAELMKSIETSFGRSTSLNGSFLVEFKHFDTSNRQSGLDLSAAIDFFEKLRGVNEFVGREIGKHLRKMLIDQQLNDCCRVEALRLYLTLPFSHLLENEQSKVLTTYAYSLNSLNSDCSAVVDAWFEEAGLQLFDRLLHLLKPSVLQNLDSVLHGHFNTKFDPDHPAVALHSLLRALERLHRINRLARPTEIIENDAFYIPELTDLIDVQNDYYRWIQKPTQTTFFESFCQFPFVFDGVAKCQILQADAKIQQYMAHVNTGRANRMRIVAGSLGALEMPEIHLYVSRDNFVNETIEQLNQRKSEDLKKPMRVFFYGEEGLDAGGVKKEFFMLLMKEILNPKYGMFRLFDETNTIWFNPASFETPDMYGLVGKVCGLAIYNDTIIDLPFPMVLYKKLLGHTSVVLTDMADLSPQIYQSLRYILDYESDDFESMFDLYMAIDQDIYGQLVTHDFVPGGRDIRVNRANAHEYVQHYLDYFFNSSVSAQFQAFYAGFHVVVSSQVLQLFTPNELQQMIVGKRHFDFGQMENVTSYKGEYHAKHPVIQWFWEVLHSLSNEDKRKFLLFLTGSDRLPMSGFKSFRILIQPTYGGDGFLPVAHTCFNLLDLPKYSSKDILRTKLCQAIEHNQGFSIV